MIGLQLAQYRIDAELGRGGMGIVYRATDTKLDRTVALKVLPASALSSEDDRARFYREAKAAAQLHHAHIATVFEIGEAVPEGADAGPSDGPRPYIAMEFIDGSTLSARIAQGPFKLPEAVRIGLEIADALKAAHGKGIVHRDIKSANIMLTADGTAKVLDFGLAKTAASTQLTRQGSTLGTVAYMSPEQARGEDVDGRTDLYALGTVMYEMVAGRLPFGGDYEQAILYAILNSPPEPLTAVRTGVPNGLEFVVAKCLSKDRELRYQTAADLVADLKSLSLGGSGFSRVESMHSSASLAAAQATGGAFAGQAQASAASMPAAAGPPVRRGRVVGPAVLGAVAGATLLVGLAAGWVFRPAPDAPAPTPRKLSVAVDGYREVVFPTASADGRYWAFRSIDTTGTSGIVIMDARTGSTSIVPESSGYFYSLFSPSGKWILMAGSGRLARALVSGGRPIDMGDDSDAGLDWLDEERIVVAPVAGSAHELHIVSIADNSSVSVPIHGLDSTYFEMAYVRRVPGTDILVSSWNRRDLSASLVAIDLKSGAATVLKQGACCASPVRGDHLVYLTGAGEGQLVAQAFDPEGLKLTGAPVDLLDSNIDEVGFGVGLDGSLMIGGSLVEQGGERLTWLDPETRQTEEVGLPINNYDRVSLSPDGRRAAIERRTDGENRGDIYVMNLLDGTEQRLTYNHAINRVPVWSRGGRIYFAGGTQGQSDIYVKNADGSGPDQLLVRNGDFPHVSEDEEWLAFVRARSHNHIFALNLRTGEEVVIDSTGLKTTDPTISPDGRYIAFSADPQMGPRVSQEQRVYVRSFPDGSQLYQLVSDDRGDDPMWSPDGKWLYYRSRGQFFRLAVSTEGTFQKLSLPEPIGSFAGVTVRGSVDRSKARLLIMHPGEAGSVVNSTRITLYDAFPTLLHEVAPASR
jgi:serine/threonine-protein kinase